MSLLIRFKKFNKMLQVKDVDDLGLSKNNNLKRNKEESFTTIAELERWLEDEFYNFNLISIGKYHAQEGDVIEVDNDRYLYCYSERGNKSIIKSFKSEKELVSYAYLMFKDNKWSKSHLLAISFNIDKINHIEQELNNLKVEYVRNDSPNHRNGNTAYRIFVFGKDIKKTEHLKLFEY
ncbi:hypothetical protein CSC2_06630 [Clostridium zeae]|uniref:Uncharacterized protein n=1 Tax=Clostridium zeae TaxID=2759022 RepID=A0ABQ1E5V7_9CLOT|nr:hypothetical protein [Clostridium zeae]GFZ30137.1 hypothetical protein CSC2_06630 [Clostridium zeae]